MIKTILLLLTLATWSFATSAYHGKITFKQDDGTVFQGQLKGDEWFNWVEDTQGDIILYNNSSKNYEYAETKMENGKMILIPSGNKVGFSGDKTQISHDTLIQIWAEKRSVALAYQAPHKACH